jgi:hypothetical protein
MRSYERMKQKMDDNIVLIVTMDLVSTELHSNYMFIWYEAVIFSRI